LRVTIWRRVLAFVLDCLFTWGALFYLWNGFITQGLYNNANSFFSHFPTLKNTVNGVELFSSIFCFWIVFIILKLFSTLLLGQSIGQLGSGLVASGKFIHKRLKGAVRVFFELFLSPFLVFDISLLFNKITLKEKLTQTVIQKGEGFGRNSLALLFLLFIPLSYNLFYKSQAYGSMIKKNILGLINNEKITLDKPSEKEQKYRSDFFKVSGAFSKDQDFVLPTVYMRRTKDGKKKMSPALYFLGKESTGYSTFKRLNDLNLLKILKEGLRGNPLFTTYYPHITQLMSNEFEYQSKSYVELDKKKHLFSEELRKEIKDFLNSSLNLYSYGPIELLSFVGPFPFGHHSLHGEINKLLPEGTHEMYDFVVIGSNEFFRKSIVYSIPSQNKKILKSYFFPIDTNNGSVYEWSYLSNGDLELAAMIKKRDHFFSHYLINSNWWFDYAPPPRELNTFFKFDEISFIDFYLRDDLDVFTLRKMEEELYAHFFQTIKNILQSNKKEQVLVIEQVLVELNYFMKINNKKKENKYSTQFLEMFYYLYLHLKNNNTKFFGIG
jgi:hypothetical protein